MFYANYGNCNLVSVNGDVAPAVFQKIAKSCLDDLIAKGWKPSTVQVEYKFNTLQATAFSQETQPGTYGDSAARSTFLKIGGKRYIKPACHK
jgi:hypothetical protein